MAPRSDFHLRLPKDLHDQMVREAEAISVSLNTYIILVLTGAVRR